MRNFREFLDALVARISASQFHWIIFFLVLGLGIFARTWEYRSLPGGLNSDEASIGVEAYDLRHFGVDRNAVSYPVHFIAWGSGQNALYGYLLIPFIALLGLSPTVVRLPMLLAGVASLPLAYFVGRETIDRAFGLLIMFFLAISPWHILLSRWGLESNIFPFVFLAGYACLLYTTRHGAWLVAGSVLLAASLYAYGEAYAMVPVFSICAAITLAHARTVHPKYLLAALLAFVVIALPIGLFLAVNSFGLNSIRLGPITIPRLPVAARYQTETDIFSGAPIADMLRNTGLMLQVLFVQSDGLIYSTVDPFGYFYTVTFPLALIGVAILLLGKGELGMQRALLLSWLGASLLLGLLQPSNFNRLNIIFIPLIVCVGVCISWLGRYNKLVLPASVGVLLLCFLAFTASYHGKAYRAASAWKFHAGLLSALQFARGLSDRPICMTGRIDMPYVYALFSDPVNPSEFQRTVQYVDPQAPLRQVLSFGRYVFGTQNCPSGSPFTYVLTADEIPPRFGNRYQYEFFDNFVVYYPKP
jgi:hypothetical protein